MDAQGKAIAYTAEELEVSEYYEAKVEETDTGFKVVNTLKEKPMVQFTISKVWDDRGDPSKRSASVSLAVLANGKQVEAYELSEKNNWKLTLKAPKLDDEGREIKYTVQELTQLKDYTVSYRDNGLTAVNTLKGAPSGPNDPKTGDDSHIGLYAALMCLSVLGMGAAVTLGKKKKHED